MAQSFGQLVINEVQSSNFSTRQDENGDYEDWIEVYNAGSTFVNLGGYGLSDNPSSLYKFTFPNFLLPSHGHILVFANDTNQTNIGAHWETAVRSNDTWKYIANVTGPVDTNWRNLSFSDASWNSGIGGIGFTDGDDSTVVPQCISAYMRRTFTITDTSKIADAVFNIDFDDGIVAYLNGVEIARINLGSPGVRPAWNDVAFANYEAKMYQGMENDSIHLDKDFLHSVIRNGVNVLAVEVHNLNSTSSDLSCIPFLSFKLKDASVMFGPVPAWFAVAQQQDCLHAAFKISKTGETIYLTNPALTVIDQVALPSLEMDHSYGRNTDGENIWKYFETTTPGTTNNASSGRTGYATIPLFSLQGGFYTGTQTLALSTSFAGGVIRYTTNGNMPTIASTQYSSPLIISSTTTVRARVFSANGMPGSVVTNTYFINMSCRMPVYSLALDSADLWDYNNGIFVLGPNASTVPPYYGANYWQDWEKQMSLEFFDKQKNRAFRFNAGLSITGGWSRRAAQKSLEVSLGDKYGLGKIQYNMVPDKSWIDKWDGFLLHTSGNDRGYAHMRDPVMERLMKGTYSDYTAYEPCLLYINGVSWGVYYTKENDDAGFVKLNYGYDKDEIDFLKERSEEFPDIIVRQGDDIAFKSMHAYAMNSSPLSSGFYAAMDSMIDIRNQVDYFAAETYYPNDDWMGASNNNLKIWRPREPGGRFRYILYDLDFGFGMYGTVENDMLAVAMNPSPHNFNSDIFQRLLQNPQYKNYFINRYADLINTNWLPSNVNAIVNSFKDSMRYDMNFQFSRWGNGDTNTWKANITNVLNFSAARPAYVRNQIQANLGMTGQVTLTIQASPPEAGRIQISTVTPATLPWSGVYFNGNPVTVTAIPNPGFTFDHWLSSVAIPVNDTNPAVSKNFAADDVITAYFTGSAVQPQVTISEINYNSDSASNAGDWFELRNLSSLALDISGWKVRDDNDHHEFVFPVTTVLPPNGYLVIAEDLQKFHAQHPAVTNVIGETGFNFSDGGDMLRLYRHNDSLLLSVQYSDQDPWTPAADGDGYTLEQVSPAGDLNDGYNWFAGCLGGSPGTAYSAPLANITTPGLITACSDDTLLLSAITASGNQYQWRNNDIDIPGATDHTFNVAENGTYYVVVTNNGCSAASDSVLVTILQRSEDPVTVPASRCGAGTVTLSASAADSIRWYDAFSNLVSSANNFTTTQLTDTTIYFARAGSTCASKLVPDTAYIHAVPDDPSVTGMQLCGHGVFTLTANSVHPVSWYDAPSGNLIIVNDTLITTDLSQTTAYYAQAGTVCKSGFVPATATVDNISFAPVAADVSRCGAGTVMLLASAPDTIRWYDAPSGNLLSTGTSFQTPSLSATTTYFLRAGITCPGNFVPVRAVIMIPSAVPVIADQGRCGSGSVTFISAASDTVRWYDSVNGNLLFTGNNFTTPVLSQSTVYHAKAGIACPSSTVPVNAVVHSVPADPITTGQSRCGNGSVTLTATGTDTIRWYDAPNGNSLFTGNSFSTPVLNQSATYYARAGGICKSNFIPVAATVVPASAPPVVSNVSRCNEGSVTLHASSSDTVRWYNVPSGNLLYTGSAFQTPFLSATATYYARAESVCPSPFIPVQALITDVTPDPVIADEMHCGSGAVTFNATATDTVRWYDAPYGNLLFTGNSYTTPVLIQNVVYYARAGFECASGIVEVHATINAISPDPVTTGASVCGAGSAALSATAAETIRWYDAVNGNLLFTGTSFVTPQVNQTTAYYARAGDVCPGNFIPAVITVLPVPAVPVAANESRCGSGTVILSAVSSDTVRWYDVPGGNVLHTGNNFTTPVLTVSATYYARSVSGCESNDIAVQATILPIADDPIVTGATRCDDGSLDLTAVSADTIQWFSAPNGTHLFTGAVFTTPPLTQTTTYYASAGTVCPGSYVPAMATIIPIPGNVLTEGNYHCGPGTIDLTAWGADTIGWYDAQGGNLLAIGNIFTTPSLNSTTTYFVRAEGICDGDFVPVTAVIHPVPDAPSVTNQDRCGSGTITLAASGVDTIRWYDSPGGNLLGEGSGFTTPVLNQTTTYYLRSETICASAFAQAQAGIMTLPADPFVSSGSTCGPGTVILSATSQDTVLWYDLPYGTLLGSGLTFQTQALGSSNTFYATAVNGCTGNFVPVNAYVFPAPELFLGNDTIIESGSTVMLDAGNGFASYLWSTGETSQTILASSTGNYWVMAVDLNGCAVTDTLQVLVTVDVQPYVLSEGVLIYPNPTHESLSISFLNGATEDIFLRLIEDNGKLVWSDFSVNEKRVMRKIDITGFARGLYVFQVATSKTKREFKVILK
jgi:hypothetical protein